MDSQLKILEQDIEASSWQSMPFLAAELGEAFDLTRTITVGLVPLVWQASDPAATLAAYAGLYLHL